MNGKMRGFWLITTALCCGLLSVSALLGLRSAPATGRDPGGSPVDARDRETAPQPDPAGASPAIRTPTEAEITEYRNAVTLAISQQSLCEILDSAPDSFPERRVRAHERAALLWADLEILRVKIGMSPETDAAIRTSVALEQGLR